jgi:L-fuconate dehydratase
VTFVSTTIIDLVARDVRLPTSRSLDGSDAMHPDPDYSAAYVTLRTDQPGLEGDGMTFTIGRGNDLCVAAEQALRHVVVGKTLESITADMAGFWRALTCETQLRWVGPEKGVIHLATGAIVNAVWDLWGKAARKPVWQLVCDMTPEELVACLDFRYVEDALTRDEALAILRANLPTRGARVEEMRRDGYPTYTTSAGWLGYPDDKLRRLCRELTARGWQHFKIKVGRNLEDDIRRCRILREELGWERKLMMDANQVWGVNEAIGWMKRLAEFKPHFIEEPTNPDDILGHATIARAIAPIGVATGEVCHNRVMFKQFLQARALGYCQIDSCRLGGVNEVVLVMLMAKKFGVPVWPHAGGVGLCEYVQHLSIIDYVCISASLEDRLTEYSDHLHDIFVDQIETRDGRYIPPTAPGYSITMKPETLAEYEFPGGRAWSGGKR